MNWLLDCLSLIAALAAVRADVPAESILITYALAQLVNQVPLLPGGGGTVELSLGLGFAAFGHTSGQVLAGILVYRVITCWGLVPIGWLAVAFDGRRFARLPLRTVGAKASAEPVAALWTAREERSRSPVMALDPVAAGAADAGAALCEELDPRQHVEQLGSRGAAESTAAPPTRSTDRCAFGEPTPTAGGCQRTVDGNRSPRRPARSGHA